MVKNNILYIGLSGLAGSGKDTAAKALSVMLSHNFQNYDDFINYYNDNVGYETKMNFKYATFNHTQQNNSNVVCVAFADRLKQLCSCLFGVPVDRFYYNKANAYICINKDFAYTECEPAACYIITAEDYYDNHYKLQNSDTRYYMSLREVLVYVGTYVMQENLNRHTFINSVNNTIATHIRKYDTKYVICTDVRFEAEYNYIKNKHGVMVRIERPGIKPLNNIAEAAIDTDSIEDVFDFIIDNDGDYNALFCKLWDMVHNNHIFDNVTHSLDCRDDSNNYIREVENDGDTSIFELCTEMPLSSVNMSYGTDINMVDPQGGPMIAVGTNLKTVDDAEYIVERIWQGERGLKSIVYIEAGR